MKKNNILIYLFLGVLGTMTIMDIVNSEKIFSEIENRYLSKKPKFKKETLLTGQFAKDYEKYINDQFVLRDNFINLKSISEGVMLKKENNNIVYGSDNYMFEKNIKFDRTLLRDNIQNIKKFSESVDYKINNIIVPYSSSILIDKLPIGLKLENEMLMINDINKYLGNGIEIGTALREEKDNYIYYKTDHHWTSYGAYLAYKEYCKANKLKAMSLEGFEEININDFYGTFYSKSKLFNSQADILTYYEMKNLKMKIGNGEYEYIYNLDNLKKRDKYSVFLDGNHSQIIIKNDEATNNKKLLVLKDSFANSFIPFVANHFDEVHVIDLRHFYGSLKEYIKLNNFDEILNVYSLKTLAEDNTIARINF